MKHEYGLYYLIYEYYVSRILFGYYKKGQTLPSIETICKQFRVAPQTARTALLRMQDAGYISIRVKRTSIVIFEQDEEAQKQYSINYFSAIKETVIDLYKSTKLLFYPLLVEGCTYLDENNLKDLLDIANNLDTNNQQRLISYHLIILQSLENPLVLNLFWDTIRFLRFPYLRTEDDIVVYNQQIITKTFNQIVADIESNDYKSVILGFDIFQENMVTNTFNHIYSTIDVIKDIDKIPFEWYIYRNRPQLCYSIVVNLICKISKGIYTYGNFLPSFASLADEYKVSVSTIRRSISLLNDIGITKTLNGKGTQVIDISKEYIKPDFSKSSIKKNLIMFFHSLSFITLTCENISKTTLESLNEDELYLLEKKLSVQLENKSYFLSLGTCIDFIGKMNPLDCIKEIYSKLYALLLWGYSLNVYRMEMPLSHEIFASFIKDILKALKTKDVDLFIKTLKNKLNDEIIIIKEIFSQHDIYVK
ncbi:GntR family transcriptional regulator [Clostridioides sp. ZZV15-6598]|uniref:GntR family transcriptional regulator n=1 Tax=Clostridioides sp. ZZV15-6598 TaxID=2811501 RepID=UPI001D114BDA|nr:GntR family transcriptional regulator [Clostridioides sp. ZZV15-6598]